MDLDYQTIAFGLIATAGFAYHTYESRKKGEVVREFCEETVPNFVERANKMINKFHINIENSLENIDKRGRR